MANCQDCSKSIRTESEIGWSGLIWILGVTAGIVYFILDENELILGFAILWAILFIFVLIYTAIAEFILAKLRKKIQKENLKCKKCRNKAICERCGISFSPIDAFRLLFHLTISIAYLSVIWGVESFLDHLQSLSSFFGGTLNHALWIITIYWLFLLVRSIYPRTRCINCGVSCKRCNQEVLQGRILTIMVIAACASFYTSYLVDPWYGCLPIFFGVVFIPYYLLGINKICDDCISEILEPLAEWLDLDSDTEEE